MKKLLIVTMLFTLALSAQAQWYVQGDLGASKIDITDLNSSDSPSFTQRISVGYAFDKNFRLAVDYTNYGKVTANYADVVDVSLKGKSLGLTGFYDFDLADFKPYVGVRVSTNGADVTANARYYRIEAFATETRIGIGALAGVQYKLTDNVALNTNIEYNRLASNVSDVGVKAGLRFSF
ncbi:opacity protein [Haemophilus influenzae]|uniref:opacity family porin n=1 Tax=Haemophilus influenzae TaxID=727 RepID=UPI0007650AC4|nr:opacity family porin [Haemophilus influenzae]CVQ36495.1 Opacity protein and related surface antigens [Streptococcus pneumoniae]MCK9044943.1 opacity family porin [Haemophilus influenzae]CWW99287.1 opacity protein [Haemophilus influenzae]CWX01589.1 opacity protein [Haemophilus influenzae]CWX18224.1 opacity protein [Haemophilus influenzae]